MDVEAFTAQGRVDPGRAAHPLRLGRGPGPRGQGGPQGLAPLGEGSVDAGEDVGPTKPESTFGTGQKIERETVPASRTSAYHAAFAEGTP